YAGNGTYTWSNGTNNTALTIDTTGTYWLEVDNNGCLDRDSINIDIFAFPSANFTWTGGCADTAITFNDNSSSSTQNWLWDFGDLTTDSIQSPTKLYTGNGTYLVNLLITDSNGCTDNISYNLTIDTAVTVDLGPDTNICGGAINLNAYVGSGVDYLWSNGATDSVINVGTTNTYFVAVDNNGCIGADTINVIVHTPPQSLFSINGNCENDSIQFNDLSTTNIVSWEWDFGDGTIDSNQNPFHIYSFYGNYSVNLKVTDTNSCINNYNLPVSIDKVYTTYLGMDTNLCGGSIDLDASANAPVSYTWSTGQTDSAITVNSTNIYWVEVNNNGCLFRDSIFIKVYFPPTAAFSWNSACEKQAVQFNDSSYSNISSWAWDFGDGNSSNTKDPSHMYVAGSYTVSLNIISGNGCSDSLSHNIVVDTGFVISIDNDTTLCQDTLDISTYGPGNANYIWSNNMTGNSITVNNTNIYICTVTRGGCEEKDSIFVTLLESPTANFLLPTDSCTNASQTFKDTSIGNINQWTWSISNGNSYTTQDITLNLDSGAYTIELIVRNILGCRDTISKNIGIIPIELDLGNDTSLCGGVLPLNADVGYDVNYNWSTGSADSAITVTSTGTYILEVNNLGCIEKDTITVDIFTVPIADYTFLDVCENDTIQFTDQSTGNILSWMWNFGDGNLSSDQSPTHTYAFDGNFSVMLQILDSNYCSDFVAYLVSVDSTFTFIVDPDTVLCANSIDVGTYGVSNATYLWPNNNTSASITVTSSGTYFVTVSRGACSSIDSVDVTLNDKPLAGFSLPIDSCSDKLHEFLNNSSSDVNQWEWLLISTPLSGGTPDSNLYNTEDITQSLTEGVYSIQLIVTNPDGCKDTVKQSIQIVVPVINAAISNDTSVYKSYSANLWADGGIDYVWSPSFSLDNEFIYNPVATPEETTTYFVVITDEYGCTYLDSVLITILDEYDLYIPSAFSPNNDGKNDLYKINGVGILEFYIAIYNRFGQKVFESNDINDFSFRYLKIIFFHGKISIFMDFLN
ncbi:MAG TPA: PKD domain-containing protein, partial [Bacteroidetes bacterium]|nr:PKD domain-containing protein [Bacteroidota bacterium]